MSEIPWIVSVDDHVVEPPSLWWDRLPTKVRERGPRVVRDSCSMVIDPVKQVADYAKGGNGPITDWWVYEDLAKPMPQTSACAGTPPSEFTLEPITYEWMRPGCYDPIARIADMDRNHTERSLCFPNISRFSGQMFLEADDKALALQCVYAYNDFMVEEWCGDSGGRLLPLCLIPLWDPILAGAEVRRNAARGCRAVAFTEMPPYLGLPSIHDPSGWWNPFFAACDETGTVICMHIGSSSRMIETSPYAPHLVNLVLTFTNAQLSLVEWVFSGALMRYPNLKLAYSESQVGWMPFVLERMDKAYETAKAWSGQTVHLDMPPSSYIPGRIYGCFFDDETGILNREAVGIDQIVFEVDYPHQDSKWPNSADILEIVARMVNEKELEKIVRTNAMEMLGLEELEHPSAEPAR